MVQDIGSLLERLPIIKDMTSLEKKVFAGVNVVFGAVVTGRMFYEANPVFFYYNGRLREKLAPLISNEVGHGTIMIWGFFAGYYSSSLFTKNEVKREGWGIAASGLVGLSAEFIQYAKRYSLSLPNNLNEFNRGVDAGNDLLRGALVALPFCAAYLGIRWYLNNKVKKQQSLQTTPTE